MPPRSSARHFAGPSPAHGAAGEKRRERTLLGVSMITLEIEFHRVLRAGLEMAAREAGIELAISVAEYSPTDQATQVDDFVAGGEVDAILMTPCDSVAVGAAIQRANQAGVPVFTVDVASTSGRGEVVSHIASDNPLGGRKAGELMASGLEGRGTVAILTHPGVTPVIERVRGFREVIAGHEGILVLGELPAWRNARAEATGLVRRLLAGTAVDGVFCTNGELTMGAVAGVEAAGRTGQVVVVGYDGTREAREAIRQGRIHAEVVQHPEVIAALAIGAVRDHLAGRPVPPVISAEIGVRVADGRGGRKAEDEEPASAPD